MGVMEEVSALSKLTSLLLKMTRSRQVISSLVFCCALLPVMQSSAAEIYVSAVANNGDGSKTSPFNSLNHAEAASDAGDSIYLLASDTGRMLDGGITLKPGQKLLGVNEAEAILMDPDQRVRLSNSAESSMGIIIRLASNNEIAGIHFLNMSNAAISGEGNDYSGTYIHHASFSGNNEQHSEDERGLVYAVSFDASDGERHNIRVEDSEFYDGEDLGAIRVFQSGDSSGDYFFQRNSFADLGGRAYFVRTQNRSSVETTILDSQADNIGRGERNSDSIIPYLMGQSRQVMLVQNYHFNNTKGEGNQSNTGIEAYMFGSPRPDEANWCTACKLTFTILDSVIENAFSDGIQFSNAGTNSELHYVIRNTRILGGNPQQGGGAISLNLQSTENSGSYTTLLVEGSDMINSTGYGFAMNNRGGGDFDAIIDFGGGVLGSEGENRFGDNARGSMRLPLHSVSANKNWWTETPPAFFDANDQPFAGARVDTTPLLMHDPR